MTGKVANGFDCPNCGAPLNVQVGIGVTEQAALVKKKMMEVKNALPVDLLKDLTVVEKNEAFHIVPKKFLGKDNFRRIMQTVNTLHGEWVSQGKTSYWNIPRQETVEP